MKQSPLQKSTVKYLQIKAGLGKGEPKAIFFLAVGCFPDSFSSIETFLKAESSFLRCSFSSQGATVVPRQHDPDTAKASMNLIPKWGSIFCTRFLGPFVLRCVQEQNNAWCLRPHPGPSTDASCDLRRVPNLTVPQFPMYKIGRTLKPAPQGCCAD